MSKNNDPPNKDQKNKIVIKKNNFVRDLSKSLILSNWIENPIINPKKSLLDDCKEENKTKITFSNITKNEKINQTNIKTNDANLNMTLNTLLNKMNTRRINNKDTKNNDDLDKIKNHLDDNSILDPSNNQLITFKPKGTEKRSLDDLLFTINKNITKYETNSSLFKYNTTDNLRPYLHNRRKSIYYPAPVKPPPPKIEKRSVNIQIEIENLDDLLGLIDNYPLKFDIEYNINMEALHNIKSPLMELKNMIGMHRLKNSIVDQILYFIQEFHKKSKAKDQDFMHTVIYGPPGTGKTETAKIIGKIFSKLGVLSRKYFKKVTRADLVAGYLGQTALKTRDVIKESIGGVLFIDEAYALGNPEKRDSFAKECIDTLCEGLSDHKDNLMVIIAGYEKELKECFFAYNQGLDSRFTWRFNTDDYNYEELFLIFKKKVYDIGWKMDDTEITKIWFQNKMDKFKFYGRDIETLLAKVKIAHGRRVFCLPVEKKMIIKLKDLNNGFKVFIENNEKEDEMTKHVLNHMYC